MRYKITTLKNTSLHHYTLWANSKEDALSKARQRDQITPLHIEAKPIFSLAPSHQDIYIALKQFHIMLLANLPLQQCITSIAQNTSNKKLSCIFENISNSLENGLSLYESFVPYENIFGKLTLVMIEFGSKSGKLCECLELLLEELHSQEIAKKEIKKVLFYPLFVFVCTIICFVFLLQTITPLFTQLFLENQLELPIYTQILISLHEKLSQYGAFILLFLFLSLIFIFFQIKSKGFLYQSLLSLLLSLPLFGKITLRTYLYQYCFTLSLLTQAGIDLLSSVLLAQQSISSQSIRHKLSQIRNSLLNGKSFYEGAKMCKLFDSLTLSLIVAAQKGENFSQVLHTCAIYYKNQNKDALDFMIALIEPLFTCLLGIFVLLLALGIFMPIWNLS